MPKMKTHRGAVARFKVTGSGKLRRRQQNRRHGRLKMDSVQLRRLAKEVPLAKGDEKNVRRMLGL